MARRRFKRAGFNTKLIMDVGLAGIATRILPMIVNKFLPLDATLYSVVGAGGTYVVGSMLKKPDLANAGIALGLVEFIAPMVEDLIGGMVSAPVVGKTPSGLPIGMVTKQTPKITVADYLSLNDYTSTPGSRQTRGTYSDSY